MSNTPDTLDQHPVPSYLQADHLGPWGNYLQQVDRVTPYLGSLARWVETLKRPKRILIVDVPIACAGLSVLPGDLVLGDADGVIAIPAAEAELVLERARLHLDKEARIRATNLAGTSDPERFDALLRAKGLPV